MFNRNRRDGANFLALALHYTVGPLIDPLFWWREINHTLRTITDPVGHELEHQRAITSALADGRPLDALANRINDMMEEDKW